MIKKIAMMTAGMMLLTVAAISDWAIASNDYPYANCCCF